MAKSNITYPSQHLVIRADASPSIGGGHIMRCLTLANRMVERGWKVTFAVDQITFILLNRTSLKDYNLVVLPKNKALCPETLKKEIPIGCTVVIIDHYKLGAPFEKALQGWAQRIFVIDDLANRQHNCDILLDQNFGRQTNDYHNLVSPSCKLLLGSAFVLLRPEFRRKRPAALNRRKTNQTPKKILISLGMTDPLNATSLALDAVISSKIKLDIEIVLGSGAPFLNMVREKCKNMTLKTALHVNPANISELIAQADIAIGAAGSSAWERCCLGLPTLNLVLADNQQFVNDRLVETGAAFQLTKSKNSQKTALAGDIRRIVFDDNLRVSLQSRAASICDGLGVGRATLLLDPLDVEQDTTLMSRPATEADTEQLFIWQCEPGARRFSRNPNPPSRAEHNGWMESRLLKREGVFEILHTADAAVGMLRLESIEGFTNTLEVSILMASEQQGQSYGRAALEIARRLLPEAIFHASIHNNNIASLKIFNSAGYKVKEDIFICEPRIES